MNKSELIKLCEEKLIEHHSFLNAVGEITLQQRLISNQAINQISWFIEKLKNLNEETVERSESCSSCKWLYTKFEYKCETCAAGHSQYEYDEEDE